MLIKGLWFEMRCLPQNSGTPCIALQYDVQRLSDVGGPSVYWLMNKEFSWAYDRAE